VQDDPAPLLCDAAVSAAVTALAERNRHHLASMTEAERSDAALHWRDLALAVLTAASAATDARQAAGDEFALGRAVVVLEDVGSDGVTVQASFHPELQDLGNGEIAGTPAQIAALELLETLGGEEEPQ